MGKECLLKAKIGGKEVLEETVDAKGVVSKQGRKPAKAEPSVHKDPLFDELADDTLDYIV
ncbi:hypothetical protein Tco_0480120, partial [Tanacetum coccineum]